MFISLAINPTTYIVIFLLLGVVLKSKRWKRLCLTLSALLFLLFSNGALYQWIAEQWYKEYDRPLPERKQYTYGIVLGGYSYWDWKRSRPEFSEIADRLLEGIRLYKHGRIRKLVLASDGSIIESKDGKSVNWIMEIVKAIDKDTSFSSMTNFFTGTTTNTTTTTYSPFYSIEYGKIDLSTGKSSEFRTLGDLEKKKYYLYDKHNRLQIGDYIYFFSETANGDRP